MARYEFSDGFCEPIVWGITQGYTTVEVALGLGITERLVKLVIESRSAVRFPRPVPAAVDPERRDRVYLNWARARTAASEALAGGPP